MHEWNHEQKQVSDGVVKPGALSKIRQETWPSGVKQMTKDLAATEPVLAKEVTCMIHNAMKLLDDQPVSDALKVRMEELLIAICLTAIFGIQKGHFELWHTQFNQ